MNEEDLRYYEHLLIKDFINRGEELLNVIYESKFTFRNRFINEMPIGRFDFHIE